MASENEVGGSSMPQEDLNKCRTVLRNLMSVRYEKFNKWFIEPFTLDQVPGYMDVVEKKLDLRTVSQNLEAGVYKTKEEALTDTEMVFHNAIKYHGGIKENKWLAKMAKEMIKATKKERKNAEKPPSKILAKQKSGTKKSNKEDSSAATSGGSEGATAFAQSAAFPTSGHSGAPALEGGTSAAMAKPKISLKLGKAGVKSKMQGKVSPTKAKPTQPKLKLKLSLNKKAADTSGPASEGGSTKSEKNKASVKSAGSRGKELPKGVTASAPVPATKKTSNKGATAKGTKAKKAATTKTTAKKIKKSASMGPTATPSAPSAGPASMMTPVRKIQCYKILSGLKRRKSKSISWFMHPVTDKNIVLDYKAKIPHPMSVSQIQNKLDKNEYSHVNQFVLDLRRIFGNCYRYNTSIKDRLRPLGGELLQTAEDLMVTFLVRGQKQASSQPIQSAAELYPPILYCWELCIKVLNTLYNLTNPSDGQPTVVYFLHPVSFYFRGHFPEDYLNVVKKPMDFGTITSNLIEGQYQMVDEFVADCKLVVENCKNYYGARDDGKYFVEQADRLNTVLTQQLESLSRYLKSPPGLELKAKMSAKMSPNGPPLFPKPPASLLLQVLEDLRGMNYTDKATKITEPAMGPFEKPVSLSDYPDYLQYVETPMDLQSVERKVKASSYDTAEDFEYDMNLVFRNCETYNAPRKGEHLVNMAKYGTKQFRKIFALQMRAFEDPGSVTTKEEAKESAVTPSTSPPNKMMKVESDGGVSKGKSAPRISIAASQVSSVQEKAAQVAKASKLQTAASNKNRSQPVKPDQPVPLHIAIARVKEAYPLRRAHKSLQSWEADCARFFKELMRHPWISAARPKFIYHVPVPTLFPELEEAYTMKIRKPMDLTTVECNLLEGNRYTTPEDFVQDVALVFSNAITFNKDGRDVGDPLSCAYFDASIHLLRYSRWLSLELLSNHVADTNEVDEGAGGDDKLPPLSWRLTEGNRKKAREEMESLVLNEPIDKSIEGDRFTWMEAECEKLLKALRHQSDLRQMTFFITPNYPADYTAFISKPMDWETVRSNLKSREYDTFGEIISDLRLIFSNALKYNARLQGTDTVSGRAYDAAKYMSAKLEAAIIKLMLTVSDRLERERIDHANAEREIEAAEQAEEAKIRAAWKKETLATDGSAAATSNKGPENILKIRAVRAKMKRHESTDFEIPFFDDQDDGQHERSYFDAVKQQKAIFEKQRQDLAKMRQQSMTTGSGVFTRMLQQNQAKKWLAAIYKSEHSNKSVRRDNNMQGPAAPGAKMDSSQNGSRISSVLSELEKEGRNPVQFKMKSAFTKKKRQNKRRAPLDFD